MTGPISIEVAACFGDSVVDVKHCAVPRGGTRTAVAWLAGAALAFLSSACVLVLAVRTAAADQRALDRWTRELHRPAYAFRPLRLPVAADVVAFGGLALAVVALGIGLARRGRAQGSASYRIGTAPGVELITGDAPAPAFPLVVPSGDGFALTYTPAIDGVMVLGDAITPLGRLAGRPSERVAGAIELPIPADARIRARVGKTAFAIAAVPPPRRCAPAAFGVERRVAVALGVSLVAHLMVLAIVAQAPPAEADASLDLGRVELASIAAHGAPLHAIEPLLPSDSTTVDPGASSVPSPIALDPHPTSARAGSSRRETTGDDRDSRPSTTRDGAIAEARTSGVLGALTGGTFASLASTGDITTHFVDSNLDGGLPSTGGGGNGRGALRGAPDFDGGFGVDRGGLGFSMHTPCGCRDSPRWLELDSAEVIDRFATSSVPGSAGAIIRRYVHRRFYAIRFCYEKALLAQPQLAGDLVAQFVILADGTTGGASADGVDADLAGCVASVFARLEFPPVVSGTVVSYPLTFRPPRR